MTDDKTRIFIFFRGDADQNELVKAKLTEADFLFKRRLRKDGCTMLEYEGPGDLWFEQDCNYEEGRYFYRGPGSLWLLIAKIVPDSNGTLADLVLSAENNVQEAEELRE